MTRRFKILVAASLVTAVFSAQSQRASSGDKQRRLICQPIATACQPLAHQAAGSLTTCCQPAATTIPSATIQLVAHTQPAPRQLTPQPDSLEINTTTATTICAMYMWANWGNYQSYYAINCTTQSPSNMNGNNLGPLPGDCNNPGGACITIGSNIIPTAASANGNQQAHSAVTQKGIKLSRKLKAGQEPSNKPNPQATNSRALLERTRIGQPIYVKFPRVPGSSDSVLVELQRFSVKGLGAADEELKGTFAVGQEIDTVPAGQTAKDIRRNEISVVGDHVARLQIKNVTYEIVTATKLVP